MFLFTVFENSDLSWFPKACFCETEVVKYVNVSQLSHLKRYMFAEKYLGILQQLAATVYNIQSVYQQRE